jgi:5-methylcytosine-specific restriction endonuclease McrA
MADPRYRTARWRRLREHVIRRDGRTCSIPGCQTTMTAKRMTHVDHRVEVSDGGSFWDLNNLHILCKPHHDAKTLTVAADRNHQPCSPNA